MRHIFSPFLFIYLCRMSTQNQNFRWHCSKCNFSHPTKRAAVNHFMFRHVPDEGIPFLCKVCNFKGLSEGKWKNHVNSMVGKPHREDFCIHQCTKSLNPYNVRQGIDVFTRHNMEPVNTTSSEKQKGCDKPVHVPMETIEPTPETHNSCRKYDLEEKEEDFVPDYIDEPQEEIVLIESSDDFDKLDLCTPTKEQKRNQIKELEEQLKSMTKKHQAEVDNLKEKHDKELSELKKKHNFECARFGHFIERQEKAKEELQKEVKTLKDKVRSLESKIRRDHLNREEEEEDDDVDPKRPRSIVTIPVKRRLNFRS